MNRDPLTREQILACRTERGGFTRATLAAWGVPWPPPKGWQKALMRGETPAYRRPRDERLVEAAEAARLALTAFDQRDHDDHEWAKRWLLAAHAAGKGMR